MAKGATTKTGSSSTASASSTYPATVKPKCLSGKSIASVRPDEILADVGNKVKEYHDSVARTDFALYDGLAKVYHFYLLSVSGSPDHASAANTLVRQYFEANDPVDPRKDKFDIAQEPETNVFGNLLRATLLNVKREAGVNLPDLHIPEKANTWSMGLHWCLRQKFLPDEALEQLQTHGVRKLYDQEMDARTKDGMSGSGATTSAERQSEIALSTIKSMPTMGAAVAVGAVLPSATGLGVFLARVKPGSGGSVIEIISQVEQSDKELEAEALNLLDKERLNASQAGPLIHLLRLNKALIGKLDKSVNLIRFKDGKLQALTKFATRSVKAASRLGAEFIGSVDGLDDGKGYFLQPADCTEILELAEKDTTVANWRFTKSQNEEAKADELIAFDYFLEADAVDGSRRWKLVSGSPAEDSSLNAKAATSGVPPTFTIDRMAWQALSGIAQQTHELADGTQDSVAPGFDLTVTGTELLVITVGTKEPVRHLVAITADEKATGRFEIKHQTLMRLENLQAIAGDGSLSFAKSDDGLIVSAVGKRATYTAFLNKEAAAKTTEKGRPGRKTK